VARYRSWPHLQTGSLLIFAIVMDLKLHSFLATNHALDEPYSRGAKRRTANCYPNNLNLLNFTQYLWFPTIIYELEYPRTKSIRISYILERTAGTLVIFCIFYVVLGHYVHPILLRVNERPALDSLVDLILPCLTSALLIFFLIFEYLLNWAAELTYFADRDFYADWWNSMDMAEFARKWNQPVHRFLQHHVYNELKASGHSSFWSRFYTFLYSSVLHELVLSFTAGRLKFWILGLQMSQLPLMYLADLVGIRRHPFVANSIWWLMIILGIPVVVLLYSRDVNLSF
jgi:sterol O-acyltransferase